MENKKRMLSFDIFEKIKSLLNYYELYEKNEKDFLSYGYTLNDLKTIPEFADLKLYKETLEDHIRCIEEELILTRELRLLVKPENISSYYKLIEKQLEDETKDLMYDELTRIENISDVAEYNKCVKKIENKYGLRKKDVFGEDKLKVRDNALVKGFWDKARQDLFNLPEIKEVFELVAECGEYSIFQNKYMNNNKDDKTISFFKKKDYNGRPF